MKLGFLFDIKVNEYDGHFYSVNLSEELWKERYLKYFNSVKLICRKIDAVDDPKGKMHLTDIDRVEVCALENKSPFKRLLNLRAENKFIEEAIKDCDVVICRGFWGTAQCKKLKKPYMIEVISCMWDAMWNHSLTGKLFAVPMFLSLRCACKESKYVLYVSEQFLQNRYPSNGETVGVSDVITTPMDMEEENTRIHKADRTSISSSVIRIGTTAAVNVAYKGQRFVIRALGILAKKGINNVEYHLAGGGDNSNLLEEVKKCGVQDRVFFHGALQHNEVIAFLDSLDIYVQPSFQEGLPRAVVEAMARGLPCIGANTGGIPELLNPEYVCEKKYLAEEIANRIELLLKEDYMLKETQRSIIRSKDFEKYILDSKRDVFMRKFVEYTEIVRK